VGSEDVTCISCATNQHETTNLGTSADGTHVLFTTDQGVWEWDASSGMTLLAAVTDVGAADAVISENGQFVVIDTSASLSSGDVNGGQDLYELSAGRQPLLLTSGSAPASRYVLLDGTRTGGVSDDGSTVVYNVVPQGAPETINEWSGGETSQISPAGSHSPYQVEGLAGSQLEDVFFIAHDALVPSDVNAGQADIYDARVGGGFASPSASASGQTTPNPVPPAAPPYAPNLAAVSPELPILPADTAHPKAPVKKLTPKQELARALQACKMAKRHGARAECEKGARKRYTPKAASKKPGRAER
jgi:hypothetical protein